MEHKGDLHPQIVIEDDRGADASTCYYMPEKAHLEVREGEKVAAGTMLAKTPREVGGTQDITGGLPRVTEIFEARRPQDPAVMAEIAGVRRAAARRSAASRTIIVEERGDGHREAEHLVPHGKHLRVHTGDYVKAGEPLVDGPLVPHDILRISGVEAVQKYLVREVQSVYRSQRVDIDDKHIEIIVSQMLRKVRIQNPGDTPFLPNAVMDKFRMKEENAKARRAGRSPRPSSRCSWA